MTNKSIFTSLLFFLVFSILVKAQSDPLKDLANPNPGVRLAALYKICWQKLAQYGDDLEILMFEEVEPEIVLEYLMTLDCLQYHRLDIVVERFNSVIDDLFIEPDQNFYARLKSSTVAISLGDTSGASFIFSYTHNNLPELDLDVLVSLKHILQDMQNRREEAKMVLLQILQSSKEDMHRRLALRYLTDQFQSEAISLYQFALTNDPEFTMRTTSAKRLIQLDSLNANILLKESIVSDTTMEARIIFSTLILDNYGTPEDLKFIIDYHPNEPDLYARDFIDKAIITFKPPRPTISTSEMIQNILVYCRELLEYGWITEENVYEEMSQMIALIEENYHGQAVPELCSNLETYLGKVEDRFNESVITIEAYKFLFYHGKYIKDNVELEFGDCQ